LRVRFATFIVRLACLRVRLASFGVRLRTSHVRFATFLVCLASFGVRLADLHVRFATSRVRLVTLRVRLAIMRLPQETFMALYAFDGTWNEAKDGDDPDYTNTNVVRFFRAYQSHSTTKDFDFYVAGVGTRFDVAGKVAGGVFGVGELARIDEAYDALCKAWAAGDRIIDIVGFSRGAATTLDFCHCIQERGIRRPGTDEVVEASPTINFLGVFDVVGSFGLANLGNTALNIGHHLELPSSNLRYAFHALALDERRPSFLPTRLEGACEVWFRGAHSDIGGGNSNRGLNDITLRWMMRKAMAANLPITQADIDALQPDPATPPKPAGGHKLPLEIRPVTSVDRGHYTLSPVKGWATLPPTCPQESQTDESKADKIGANGLAVLPTEVRRRIAAMWEAAEAIATREDMPLDDSKDFLLTLFQGRVPLVTNDEDMKRAQVGAAQLVANAIRLARNRGEHRLAPFYVNEALFNTRHLYPLTD
jgi:hypothetical protein